MYETIILEESLLKKSTFFKRWFRLQRVFSSWFYNSRSETSQQQLFQLTFHLFISSLNPFCHLRPDDAVPPAGSRGRHGCRDCAANSKEVARWWCSVPDSPPPAGRSGRVATRHQLCVFPTRPSLTRLPVGLRCSGEDPAAGTRPGPDVAGQHPAAPQAGHGADREVSQVVRTSHAKSSGGPAGFTSTSSVHVQGSSQDAGGLGGP